MKSLNKSFSGFSPEMLSFLFELKFSNTIDKQAENLIKYKKLISEPLMLLYEYLLKTVLDSGLSVETKPSRCVSTPYTDRRFSPQTPLKEYMYIRFRQIGKKADIPGLYFDMGIDHYGYGIRIYKQTALGMDRLRERIKEDPQKFSFAIEELATAGFKVIGEKYKKDHFPEMPECKAKEILNRRNFYLERAVPVGEAVFSPTLAEELSCAYRKLSGFYLLLAESLR